MSSLPVLRQSAAELLALVVTDLFPGALLARSVATEFGFFCDIIATQPIDDYALPLIEEKMRGYAKQNLEVKALDMMREVAANYLEHKGQSIRADAVRSAKENIVSLIQIGDFADYCQLPYISEAQEVESFKIFKIEPAVCFIPEEGMVDVKRIHGTVSTDKQSLKKLVKALQAGRKSDHTNLPKERELFSFHEEISTLSCVWERNGAEFKRILTAWWEKEHKKQQFRLVSTPSLVKESLTRKAGVYHDHFAEIHPPVFEINDTQYVIAPTVAPAHMVLFQEKLRSSREMPIRIGECAPVVSLEQGSNLWGAFDSTLVSADFAHIFCAPEHLEEEFISSLQFIDKFIKMFGFEYYWYFKGRGEKFAGTVNRWEKATLSLDSAFQKSGFTYVSDPQESAFAGPVAEARLIDSCGREWKGPTVGLDFNSPDRMALRYQGTDGKTHVPLMIVRSLFGSFERFVALLLENTSGVLPLWLAPEQVRVLPVKMEYDANAKAVRQAISDAGYRAEIDYGHEQIGKKVTKAQHEKVPYLIIIGEKEENEHLITLRSGIEAHQQIITVEAFLKLIGEVTP
ncbi:MAG TPA: threonine--tRNA ligase [Parachlamydiaceae bacterium]|nr:threonine--tRNA ligase [Parachlamydiaceae bacterium]